MRTLVGPLAAVLVATLAATVTGCSSGQPSADKCQSVSAELIDIPTRTDQEPRMAIPLPKGWERSTKSDSEQIRFAIRNPALMSDGFTPNAVVTLQKTSAEVGKPQQILEAQNDQLAKKLKVTDMSSVATEVCGVPGLSTSYIAPEVKLPKRGNTPPPPPIPPRKATSLGVVLKDGDVFYVATLTVQTIKPDNPIYTQDSETILKGFRILSSG